ncbi:hypothetical protein [Sinomicrobium sp. M5D2P9]
MKKIILYISFGLFLLACKKETKENIVITDEFKLEFLNQVLSDTTELKVLLTKSQLISNAGFGGMTPPLLPVDPKNSKKTISHWKFISDSLKVSDTMFIRKQVSDNIHLDLNRLEKYGFNVFDLKSKLENNEPYSAIIDSISEGTENYGILKFNKPIFNKDKNLAYLMLEQGAGGQTLILALVDGKWKKKNKFGDWVE